MDKIKTWQTRYNDRCEAGEANVTIHGCMEAEIAELRAALASSATPEQPSPQVDDLAALIRRLVHAVRRSNNASNLASQALDYLQRHGLGGSPMRDVEKPTSDLSKAILALPLPEHQSSPLGTFKLNSWEAEVFARGALAMRSAAAALASQPAAQEQDKIDAQRYRFLRKGFGDMGPDVDLHNAFVDGDEKMDAAIDKAVAAQLAQSADKAEG